MMVDEYLLLDVYNNYWFYPDWTQDIDQVTRVVQSGVHDMEIFNVVWPMVDGSAEGIEFLYLMTAPDTYSLVSNLAIVEFGYE